MLNQMKIFKNDNFKVKTKINNDGEVIFNAADIAKSLGITTVAKSGNVCIRWNRVNEYLKSILPEVEKIKNGDFIPESAVYLLAMKANNDTAIQFQIWLSTEVLPSIRQYGAYIAPDANKETVDNLEKFSKYRIKKTFSNASKGDIQKLLDDFDEFLKTMSAKDTITAVNSAIKGLETFKDNNKDSNAYQFLIDEKLRAYTKLLLTKHNKVNGGIKAHKTKQIKTLNNDLKEWQDYANSLYPLPEEFITIPVHPFSINSMYSLNVRTREKKRSKEYNNWIHTFPKVDWPKMESDKFYSIYLEFEHLKKFDTDNFSKSLVDQIVRETGVDDSNFLCISAISTNFVDNFEDGKIHLCIKEIN